MIEFFSLLQNEKNLYIQCRLHFPFAQTVGDDPFLIQNQYPMNDSINNVQKKMNDTDKGIFSGKNTTKLPLHAYDMI